MTLAIYYTSTAKTDEDTLIFEKEYINFYHDNRHPQAEPRLIYSYHILLYTYLSSGNAELNFDRKVETLSELKMPRNSCRISEPREDD